MQSYISILRGINVGGKRKILMKDLKEIYQNLGFLHVQTYIQSGNVVFQTNSTPLEITKNIQQVIFETYNFEVPVLIRTKEELQKIYSSNPFLKGIEKQKEKDILIQNNLHLTFLDQIPTQEIIQKAKEIESKLEDKFEILENNVFVFCAGKYHISKLSNAFFEKKCNAKATTRNWKTIQKLVEIMEKEKE